MEIRKKRVKKLTQMQIVALGCLAVVLIGTLLLSLPISSRSGDSTGLVDAFMTSTSAACVTGLIPVGTYSHWSTFGQAVILVLIQVGGIGFMTVIALLNRVMHKNLSLSGRKIFQLSASGDSIGGVTSLITSVSVFTLAFEAIGAATLAIRFIPQMGIGRGIWYAVFHSVSAFCNAGFDLMGQFGQASLTGYVGDITVNITVMVLILAGGFGFAVWQDLFANKFKFKKCTLHTRVVLTMNLILFTLGACLFFVFEHGATFNDLNTKEQILSSLFNSVTPRTAGFNTVDLTSLSDGSIALSVLLMIIGGAPGSTAGGIKVTTLIVLLSGTLASARQVDAVNLFRRRISEDTVRQASAIATIYFCIASFSIVTICAVEPFPIKSVIFEVVSALSNVGMTLGITPSLTDFSKILISMLMYFGRIGLLSLVISLAAKRESVPITRPTENIML